MYEEKLLALQCTSVFAPCMIDFVEQKRALGNKYNACVEVFNGFDRFCNELHLEAPTISKDLLSLWEEKRPTKMKPLSSFEYPTYANFVNTSITKDMKSLEPSIPHRKNPNGSFHTYSRKTNLNDCFLLQMPRNQHRSLQLDT